jgi:DNA invertase Pin-like site-specific DNA recombinase
MRYIYARVSTEDQNVKQQADYLADKYEHDSVVQEKFTGTTTDRPKFQQLLKQLKHGDALIVYHVSRLGRKTSEVLEVVEQLQDRGVEVYVDQLQGIDITSGVGKLLFTMLSGLAELEKEQLLERQRIGINRAKAEGKYKGRKQVDREILKAVDALREQGYSVSKACKAVGVGEATYYRSLKEA